VEHSIVQNNRSIMPTPGVTVTETINADGSKTITTVTIHADGSQSTQMKTMNVNRAGRSLSPTPQSRTGRSRVAVDHSTNRNNKNLPSMFASSKSPTRQPRSRSASPEPTMYQKVVRGAPLSTAVPKKKVVTRARTLSPMRVKPAAKAGIPTMFAPPNLEPSKPTIPKKTTTRSVSPMRSYKPPAGAGVPTMFTGNPPPSPSKKIAPDHARYLPSWPRNGHHNQILPFLITILTLMLPPPSEPMIRLQLQRKRQQTKFPPCLARPSMTRRTIACKNGRNNNRNDDEAVTTTIEASLLWWNTSPS